MTGKTCVMAIGVERTTARYSERAIRSSETAQCVYADGMFDLAVLKPNAMPPPSRESGLDHDQRWRRKSSWQAIEKAPGFSANGTKMGAEGCTSSNQSSADDLKQLKRLTLSIAAAAK